MSNLQSYTNGMQSPDQAFQAANQQFGVPGLQSRADSLGTAVDNTSRLLSQIAPSVMGRTANSLVDDAQATRMIANESAPLQTQLNQETTDYNKANSNFESAVGQAQNLANANLSYGNQRQSYLQGIYNDYVQQEQQASQQAEAVREFNLNRQDALSNAARASGAASQPKATENKSGGWGFTDSSGSPITAAQYAQSTQGNNWQAWLANFVTNSSNDPNAAKAVTSGMGWQDLVNNFPYIFGGT
jgi:hypothetical protein